MEHQLLLANKSEEDTSRKAYGSQNDNIDETGAIEPTITNFKLFTIVFVAALFLVNAYLRYNPNELNLKHTRRGPYSSITVSSTYVSHENIMKLQSHQLSKTIQRFEVIRSDGSNDLLAEGTYIKNVDNSGWNHLNAKTGDNYFKSVEQIEDFDKYFLSIEAMGYLEGYATSEEINNYYINFYSGLFDGGDPMKESVKYLLENHEWMVDMAEKHWRQSSYWLSVKTILVQLDGLLHGLQKGYPGRKDTDDTSQYYEPTTHYDGVYLPSLHKGPSLIHLLILNANGDLYQISSKFNQPQAGPSPADDDEQTYADDDDIDDDERDDDESISSNIRASGAFSSQSKNEEELSAALSNSVMNDLVGIRSLRKVDSKSAQHTTAESESYKTKYPPINRLHKAQAIFKQLQSNEQELLLQGEPQQLLESPSLKLSTHDNSQSKSLQSSINYTSAAQIIPPARRRRDGRPARGGTHCSAIIRMAPNNQDIFFGHNTWDDYQCGGPRIFKRYTFPVLSYVGDSGALAGDDDEENYSDHDLKESKKSPGEQQENSENPSNGIDTELLQESNLRRFSRSELARLQQAQRRRQRIDERTVEGGTTLSSSSSEYLHTGNSASAESNNRNHYRDRDAYDINNGVNGPLKVTVEIFDTHFSSSPGYLTSMDDYFLVKGRGDLAVMETSEDVIDEEILAQISSSSMLCWARTRVANQLATSGERWARLFSLYHSGTYTNQWMVIDFNRFTPGQQPQPDQGVLTVLEELPGYVRWEDMSSTLGRKGYWASFNNAYFDDVREISGAAAVCQVDDTFCYDTDPRAVLFRRLQGSITDLETLKTVMGYNHFRTDDISNNDPCNAISCRSDLHPDPSQQYPFGAVDSKISSALAASPRFRNYQRPRPKNGRIVGGRLIAAGNSNDLGPFIPFIWARFGPAHDDLPPFCWSQFEGRVNSRNRHFSHISQPHCFDRGWQLMPPQ